MKGLGSGHVLRERKQQASRHVTPSSAKGTEGQLQCSRERIFQHLVVSTGPREGRPHSTRLDLLTNRCQQQVNARGGHLAQCPRGIAV